MIYHYYGDTVRRIFLIAAFVMALTLPFFVPKVPVPFYISLSSIPLLVLLAGLTNPREIWVLVVNVVASIAGSIVFEYYAVFGYRGGDMPYFIVNQVLAVIFLIAVYFSMKTLRGRRHERDISDMD
jgi:hypothetical protein